LGVRKSIKEVVFISDASLSEENIIENNLEVEMKTKILMIACITTIDKN